MSEMSADAIVQVNDLRHAYGERVAMDGVSLSVTPGEIFGFLGPNGSGKSTLFRILSTLIAPQSGTVRVAGADVVAQRDEVRAQIGVVFQYPSLDKQLTAWENLIHHGHLYGLRGAELKSRATELLSGVGLADRIGERVESFSGGMRRRVELAKGLLNHPRVLLMDEPSTGLDPAARIDLWSYLRKVRERDNVTILMTTHLMDEAEHCDRIAIMDHGKKIAEDTPSNLRAQIGGDVVLLTTNHADTILEGLRRDMKIDATKFDRGLRIERERGHELIPQVITAFPGLVDAVSVSRPTLEDVFVHLTGHRIAED
jgi:ABC-2 type transport system ATP-binding protein